MSSRLALQGARRPRRPPGVSRRTRTAVDRVVGVERGRGRERHVVSVAREHPRDRRGADRGSRDAGAELAAGDDEDPRHEAGTGPLGCAHPHILGGGIRRRAARSRCRRIEPVGRATRAEGRRARRRGGVGLPAARTSPGRALGRRRARERSASRGRARVAPRTRPWRGRGRGRLRGRRGRPVARRVSRRVRGAWRSGRRGGASSAGRGMRRPGRRPRSGCRRAGDSG